MNFRAAIVSVAWGVLAVGCATGQRAYMDSALSNRSEAATVWDRPQEVGFDFGADATGDATRQCVLGFICWGSEGESAAAQLSAFVGSLTGNSHEVDDPLVRAAAAVAVDNTPKAEGIFVVSHVTDSFNIFVYEKRTAHVKGKTITLRRIGEVSQDRADKLRNLAALGGKGLVQVQP
jgi:hypothetical protein